MNIDEEFTERNFISYGKACYDAALEIEGKWHEGYRTLLVPSRGAVPPAGGIIYSLKLLKGDGKSNFIDNVRIPKFLQGYPGFEDIKTIIDEDQATFNILLYPFTADINIKPEILKEYGVKEENINPVKEIREFGSKVVKSFFYKKDERMHNEQFRIFTSLLRHVEGRNELADEYEKFPPSDRMLMLDTVVSGRASATIINNFELLGLGDRLYNILLVDKNGEKLRRDYKSHLKEWESRGKLKLIYMNRIFSEDRGAGVLGVVGVIFPSLMLEGGKYTYPMAAVTWHPLPKTKEYQETFKKFEEAIFDSIQMVHAYRSGKSKEELVHMVLKLRQDVKEVIQYLKDYELLKTPDPSFAEKPGKYINALEWMKQHGPIKSIYETSAHVVHICFESKYTKKLAEKIMGINSN